MAKRLHWRIKLPLAAVDGLDQYHIVLDGGSETPALDPNHKLA